MILDAPGLLQGLPGPRKGIRHRIPIQLSALRHTLGFNRLALRDLPLNLGNQRIQVRLGRRNVRPGRLDRLQHPIRLVNVRLRDADRLDQTGLLAGWPRSQIPAHINLLFRLRQCCLRDLHIMVDRRQRFRRERPPQIRHLLHGRRDPGLQIHRGLREPLQRLRRIHQEITHVRKILRLLIQDIISPSTRRNDLDQQ